MMTASPAPYTASAFMGVPSRRLGILLTVRERLLGHAERARRQEEAKDNRDQKSHRAHLLTKQC